MADATQREYWSWFLRGGGVYGAVLAGLWGLEFGAIVGVGLAAVVVAITPLNWGVGVALAGASIGGLVGLGYGFKMRRLLEESGHPDPRPDS